MEGLRVIPKNCTSGPSMGSAVDRNSIGTAVFGRTRRGLRALTLREQLADAADRAISHNNLAPAFAPLEQRLRQRQVNLTKLQSDVYQFLAHARQFAPAKP